MSKKTKPQANSDELQPVQTHSAQTGRRAFLNAGAGTGLATALMGLVIPRAARADDYNPLTPESNYSNGTRADFLDQWRDNANEQDRIDALAQPIQFDNNDETLYENDRYYASFTKTLPCNAYGEVNPAAFEALQTAMRSGTPADFDAIPLAGSADRRLANPQGAFKFEPSGLDSHASRIAPSHAFNSAALAGEMVEVYWQAICRDVAFENYGSNGKIAQAVADLNALSATPAAAINGPVSAGNIFRGETPGDLVGPYISQFLWKDFSFGSIDVVQKYETPVRNVDFMTTIPEWRRIQRGQMPSDALSFRNRKRYIYSNRALAEYVHRDVSFQAYLQAALILLSYGPSALASTMPYSSSTNQGAFVSHGAPFILDLVTKAANAALGAAWFQKWRVHRFLRPEALGGRVHFHKTGDRTYDLHPDLLNAQALTKVFAEHQTYLLPQAYPEGSPTHPSYPAGHACVAGACVTVLKAMFNGDFVIPDPVVATNRGRALVSYSGANLTVRGELNKLANNISIGRDAAGVHYRQDGIQGMFAGEQVALELLREHASSMNESGFTGYSLTKFDGTPVTVS